MMDLMQLDTTSHVALFNDARYHRMNLRPGQIPFRYDHVVGGVLVGTLAGVVCDGLLDCGYSAPFGGIDFARDDVLFGSAACLLDAACTQAKVAGIDEIRLRARPAYFGANEAAVEFALLNRGARVESCEASLGLEPWRYQRADDYVDDLKSSARRALRHGLGAGFEFRPANDPEWPECYDLLEETRRRRGARLSISFDYLMALRPVFADRIAMHRLACGDDIAGAALVYRVTRDWDYVVAWGDVIEHRPDGVVNVLAYQLMRLAIARRGRVIDLGISSVDGVADDGLIQFKRNIGAATGLRKNFRFPLR
jgi:hypothetical protein